jgi:hypothetical protein
MSLTNLSFQKRISRLHHQSRSHREGGARAASGGHTLEASSQNLRYEVFQHPRWGTFLSLMHASSLLTLSQSFQLLEELARLSIIHSNYVSIHFPLSILFCFNMMITTDIRAHWALRLTKVSL